MSRFDARRLERLGDVMAGHVLRDSVAGLVWLAARDEDPDVGSVGTLSMEGDGEPVRPDSMFRIPSMTKPIVAAGCPRRARMIGRDVV